MVSPRLRSPVFASLVVVILAPFGRAQESFVTFESGHVRPLAVSADGELVFAVNTPDNRVEIFRPADGELLARVGEVRVGLEPVALALRGSDLFVVNHLSDSVSVVDISDPSRPWVRATLLVGDEPRDIVMAGAERERVFVATAHRGQNDPRDPEFTTPGVGRADVWVFDARDLSRVGIVNLFTDTPRALAASPDGTRVYAAGFHSGNGTTCLTQLAVDPSAQVNAVIDDGFQAPGTPEPTRNGDGVAAPEAGLIVQHDPNDGRWRDDAGQDWSPRVRFDLPDRDVFTIDATATPPVEVAAASGVGTILFGLAVHPRTGAVWCSNIDSRNVVRFEPVLNGHLAESRVTIIDGGGVRPVHLNPHIDYSTPSGPAAEIEQSLAFPLGMEFTGDGETLFVAAFGSGKVGVLASDGSVVGRIDVGGGPSGVALDEGRGRLYVMSRFEHAISVVSTNAREEVGRVPLRYDPEPAAVREGRPLLYDARNSGHGDSACASCHIFGDFDSLAWDLGDPGGAVEPNPLVRVAVQSGFGPLAPFHPMKGPMTTQSLRGMKDAGPMHWRGDRNGVSAGFEDGDVSDEGQAFLHFRGAFQGLLGMSEPLPMEDMERFRDFILEVAYPPNPIAPIDGSLTANQRRGKEVFDSNGNRFGLGGDGDRCADCHTLPFGTDGRASFELEPQEFKVAHLRNLYQKVGMFGYAMPDVIREPGVLADTPTPHLGEQVRGFGFLHDGSIPTLFNFFRVRFAAATPFTFPDQPGRTGNQKVRELESFLLAFPTGLAPVVGHQVTLDAASDADARERYATLAARADAGDCDLVASLRDADGDDSLLRFAVGRFRTTNDADLTELDLIARIDAGATVTFTAVPRGSGMRIAIDRDEDGFLDGVEVAAGSDPADPASVPGGGGTFLRGNCNGDRQIDLSDPIAGLRFLFLGGDVPSCRDACDTNVDGRMDISDSLFTLNFLFLGGPPPGAVPECEAAGADCAEPFCP